MKVNDENRRIRIISQRHGSADPDPDPHQNVMDPRHWERLDQGHLHPPLEHPETNMPRPGIEPVSPASQASSPARAIRTAFAVAIRNLYMYSGKKLTVYFLQNF